jgi:hypothetical protein
MSTAAIAAIDPTNAPDAFASTRANYERFAFLLLRVGHVPGIALSHLDFRVLLFLLGQKPGHYAAHHRTIAAACNSNPTSIKQSLGRLRAAGLALWELIPPHHCLPSGRYTRTNVNRYWVHLPRLAALLEPASLERKAVPSTRPDPAPSTRPISASSYGTEILNDRPTPLTPQKTDSPPAPEPARAEEEAVLPIEFGSSETAAELAPICVSWEKLGLGKLDHRSTRALGNRRAEGATLEQLEAAVAGAGTDDWIRRRAKVPFAVVFATLASIDRFAHQGRKILDAREHATRMEAEEQRKIREWRVQQRAAFAAETPPTASELRELLPAIASPPPLPVAPPMTAEEFARHRVEQLARFEAWGRENALAEGT